MSLLIDALRQAEAGQRQTAEASPGTSIAMTLEPVTPTPTRPEPIQTPPRAPPNTTASPGKQTPDNREALKELFELKPPAPSKIPLVLAAGGLLALAGGAVYIWQASSLQGGIQTPLNSSVPTSHARPSDAAQFKPNVSLEAVAPIAKNESPGPAIAPPPAPPPLQQQSATHHSDAAANQIEPGIVARASPAPHTQLNPTRDAHAAYQQGRLAQAHQLYTDILRQDPNSVEALNALALIAFRTGRHAEAEQHFRHALASNPKDAFARSQLNLLYSEGAPAAAESRLRGLLAEQPDSAPALFALGSLYAREGRWSEAQQSFFQAHTLDQGNADTLYNLAVSLDHLRQTRLAAQYYERAASVAMYGNAAFDPLIARERARRLIDAETAPMH